jgi:hypothetical protein
MRISLVMAIVVSSMLLGCGDPTSTEVASSLNGAWTLRLDPPEGFFGFSLTPSGSDVAGEGSFAGEAGPQGDLSVSGSVVGNTVDLDFVLVTQFPEGQPTRTAHFTGHLTFGTLQGGLRFGPAAPDNPPQSAVFTRDN